MKISNGIKQEYNNKNTYKMVYKQIKEEIKNVVINKYIKQIELLSKNLEKLKKENLLLKNDLIYILKRVLLNKNDYSNVTNNQNLAIRRHSQVRNIYSINGPSNTSLLNNKSYNSFFSAGETINNDNNNYNYNQRNINNSIIKSPSEQRRYSIDDENKKGNNTSVFPLEVSKQTSVQNKINYYLNSLYKHNFAEECAAGTASIHLLNKDQSIYDELFVNKNKNKVISHLNTDKNYKKISNSRGKSYSKTKIQMCNTSNSGRHQKIGNIYNIQKNKTNGYLKVKKKDDTINEKLSDTRRVKNKKNNHENNSSINIIVNTYYKNSKFNGSSISSRSRFLVNKF